MARLAVALFLLASLGLVLGATLWPTDTPSDPAESLGFLTRGLYVADALRNVMLFLPLGAALALALRSPLLAVVAAAGLSMSLELAQGLVPGRHSALEDLLFNAGGAVLGATVVLTARHWIRPSDRLARALGAGAAAVVALLLLLTVRLFDPWLPESEYFAGWTPELPHLETYRGRVVDASIADAPLPHGAVADSQSLRRHLGAEAPLHIRAVAGPPPAGLAPLFTIIDGSRREILLVGVDGDDLVISQRVRGRARRLEQPRLHLPGWLADVSSGDALDLRIEPSREGYCVALNDTRRCALGLSLGAAWSFVFLPRLVPGALQTSMNALWLLALFVPLGYWHRSWRQTALLGLGLLALLLLLPRTTGLVRTPLPELLGPALGFTLGLGLQRLARRPARREA